MKTFHDFIEEEYQKGLLEKGRGPDKTPRKRKGTSKEKETRIGEYRQVIGAAEEKFKNKEINREELWKIVEGARDKLLSQRYSKK